MIEVALNNVGKYYGANKALENITFEAKTGERLAIVGRNGTGKTTVFKIVAGIEGYNGGQLFIRKGATIGYLDQIPNYPDDYRVIDVLNTAFQEEFKVRKQMRELEEEMSKVDPNELEAIMKKYGELQNSFEHMGGYDIEEKISKISSGLKIADEFKEREFAFLSGGEKTTVILGKILLQNPDVLLLDEPSNHLDIESVEWLEEFLKDYKGSVITISHDRFFLDKVVTRIVEIEDKKTSIYEGNYSYYVDEKKRRLQEQYETYQNQQKKIKSMEDAIKRFREWGTRADNPKMFIKARNMEKRIEKMDKVDRPIMDRKKINLDFSANGRSGKDVIKVSRLSKSFGDNLVLDGAELHIRYSEKVALLGKNGSGKSTLIKLILGEYLPEEGKIELGSRTKIGYLDQNINFENENLTILEAFKKEQIISEGEARGILARFLFYGEDVFKRIGDLSGGEKSRLKLCQLMYQDINLLILDEPTNHLDIDSREMLEEALREFEGTILFISHDRYFINKIAERIVEIRDNSTYSYVGDYSYYRQKRNEEILKASVKQLISRPIRSNENNTKETKENSKKVPSKYSIQIRNEKIEKEIEEIESLIKIKEEEMEKYATDHEKLTDIYVEKEALEAKLNLLLEQWTELNSDI